MIKETLMKRILLLAGLFASFTSIASVNDKTIETALKKYNMTAESIKPSPIVGLNTVVTANGVVYVTDDGKYLLEGPIYDISTKTPTNITNKSLMKKIDDLKDEMIVFKAPKEKYVVTVFTDITCGYCKKLHSSVNEMNDKGITVRYLAFPRQGLQHESAKQMASIWCNALPQKALTDAFKGESVAMIDNCKIDFSRHMQVGKLFGLTGTPAILLDDGQLISGYLSADALAKALDNK